MTLYSIENQKISLWNSWKNSENKTSAQYEFNKYWRNSYSNRDKTQNAKWIKTGIIKYLNY